MDLANLENILKDEPSFRMKQVEEAVFGRFIESWSEATNLSLSLREKLNKECPLSIKAEILSSKKDDALKSLLIFNDGLKAESVLMRHSDGRNTVCVSSQVGCPMGCLFCATGKMGFKRNLESLEIVEQVILFSRQLKKSGEKVSNVTFMGMGEPFLNYENAMEAIRIINKKIGIGARNISISTIGIVEGIRKLIEEPLQVNLAISLHATNNELRTKIIPANKKYPLEAVMKAVSEYISKKNRKVMFEYVMIDGLNDSEHCAKELASLLKKLPRWLYLVNLIAYNPTGIFKPSSSARIEKFREVLEKNNVLVTQRYRFGRELKAACGQLGLKRNSD